MRPEICGRGVVATFCSTGLLGVCVEYATVENCCWFELLLCGGGGGAAVVDTCKAARKLRLQYGQGTTGLSVVAVIIARTDEAVGRRELTGVVKLSAGTLFDCADDREGVAERMCATDTPLLPPAKGRGVTFAELFRDVGRLLLVGIDDDDDTGGRNPRCTNNPRAHPPQMVCPQQSVLRATG